jgi:hypothetical protein
MRACVVLGLIACGGHGAGGDGSTDAPPAAPLTAEQLALACESVYGCIAPPIGGPTIPDCLTHLYGGDVLVAVTRADQIRCLAAAGGDCTVARACIGYAMETCTTPVDECRGDTHYSCDGTLAVELDCRSGAWFTSDSTCVTGVGVSGVSNNCGLGTCTNNGSTTTTCDGSRIVACQSNGVREPIDCNQFFGETCSMVGSNAECTGMGAACTGGGHCEGTTLVRCDGGHEQRVDCPTVLDGGTCLPIGSGGATCNFDTACTPSGATATCNGTTSSLCILGTTVNVDCAAAGFASCAEGSCLPAHLP